MKEETQFDRLASTYDEGLEQLLSPYMNGTDTNRFAEYKVQLVHELLKRKRVERILDFGCGTGRSLSYFKKYFKEAGVLYGCDVSSESVKIAADILPEAHLFVNSSVEEFDDYFGGGRGWI